MIIERFKREIPDGLVIIKCQFPNHGFSSALDTGDRILPSTSRFCS